MWYTGKRMKFKSIKSSITYQNKRLNMKLINIDIEASDQGETKFFLSLQKHI